MSDNVTNVFLQDYRNMLTGREGGGENGEGREGKYAITLYGNPLEELSPKINLYLQV